MFVKLWYNKEYIFTFTTFNFVHTLFKHVYTTRVHPYPPAKKKTNNPNFVERRDFQGDLGFLERGSFSKINVSVFVNDVVGQDVCFEKGTRCFVGQHVHNEIQSIHPTFGCTLLVHDALVGIKCQGQRGMHVSGLGLQSMHKRYNFGRRWIASTVEIKHVFSFDVNI